MMDKLKLCGAGALLFTCMLTTNTYAQTSQETLSMTLEECIEYAKTNSITLQKARLQVDDSQSDILSAKGSFLPTISGSVSQSVGTNPLSKDSDLSSGSYSGSYGLDLSLSLYNGGKNKALFKQSQIGADISNFELEELVNSIEVSVTEVYVEILYAIEQIVVAEKSLEISIQTEERGRAFFEAGSINSVDLAQLESARASYQYALVVAKAQLSNMYVTLKHLLELSPDTQLSVLEPKLEGDITLLDIPTMRDVYDSAITFRPEIMATKLDVSSAELSEVIAKAGYLPTLNLTAGTGVNHSSHSSYDFSSQLRENFSTSAGLNLSVPIFKNYSNKVAVAKAQNSVKRATLNLTDAEKNLYQTIETLHNNALTAQAKFSVSEYQLEATRRSMDLTAKQYEVGMKNTIDLLTEQDNYNQSFQDYLVNKYQFLYNRALLNYYKTNIIKL